MSDTPRLPNDLPKCECFTTDDAFTMGRLSQMSENNNVLISVFYQLKQQSEFCDAALPLMLELLLVQFCIAIGVHGTIIESGTQEAEWEAVRVMTGLEARVIKRIREMHEEGRRMGLTAEKVKAMRERDQKGSQS